jgi:hypothetical protein
LQEKIAAYFVAPFRFLQLITMEKMNSRKYILLLTSFIFLLSCSSNNEIVQLKKFYEGYWYETIFQFHFLKNGAFIFETSGHAGDIKRKGSYYIQNDTLSLKQDNNELIADGIIGSKFLIKTVDACILDLVSRRSYCEDKKLLNQKDIERDEFLTIELVKNLPVVINRDSIVKSTSRGRRNLSFIIYERPSERLDIKYWIKVIEKTEMNFVTHFNYLVNPTYNRVEFIDTVNDKIIHVDSIKNNTL